MREDILLEAITRVYQQLFEDADSMVDSVLREARKLADANRGEAQRVRGQLAEIDKKIGPLTRLLMDPEIDSTAKKAISRQLGEAEGERERLLKVATDLAERASDDTERLAQAAHQAIDEARKSFALAASPGEMREFVEQYVGPMVLKADGTVAQKETTPEGTEVVVKRPLARAGFEPTTGR